MQAAPISLPVPVPLVFDPIDVAFAFAWADRLPVHQWAVFLDSADDGSEYLTVETPGSGLTSYHVLPHGAGVTATLDPWNKSPPMYVSLRAFLLALFPLPDADLQSAEAEASLFCKPWGNPATGV